MLLYNDADGTQCGSQAIRAGQGGCIKHWVVAVRGFDLNAFARANRVAVRVRFPSGGSKIAFPRITHVDMLAGSTRVAIRHAVWRF